MREGSNFLPKGWWVSMGEWREDRTWLPNGRRMKM